jgi:PTH1 family peptidyl-tRNA hydrolase
MNYIFLGLGNPGVEYFYTRHNAGNLVLRYIAEKENISFSKDKYSNSLLAKFSLESSSLVFSLPETFMNSSGFTAEKLCTQNEGSEIVVVYDDIDIPLGEYKVSFGRSGGSHNGMKSVISSLRSQNFISIRVGVSPKDTEGKIRRPVGKGVVQDFVMSPFSKNELVVLEKLSENIYKTLPILLKEGREKFLSTYKK